MGSIYFKGVKVIAGLVLRNPGKTSLPTPESPKEAPIPEKPPSTIQEPERAPESAGKRANAGTACDICSLDHISTCAGILEEANRFARRDGVGSPEVIRKVSICREQLNALERDDANPQKLVQLPRPQREIMEKILPRAGELRHRLNEIVSLETLEQVTAETQNLSDEFQNAIFHLQVKKELTKGKEQSSPNPGSQYVTIEDPGKTTFKPGEVISKDAFDKENERVRKLGGKPATGTPDDK